MKNIIVIITIVLLLVLVIEVILLLNGMNKIEEYNNIINNINHTNIANIATNKIENADEIINNNIINEWNLVLVNYENSLPSNFEPQLSYIDSTRKFDTRAIDYLSKMLKHMKKDNIKDIWVQSSYRSIESQQKVFNKKIDEYVRKRKVKKRSRRTYIKINK